MKKLYFLLKYLAVVTPCILKQESFQLMHCTLSHELCAFFEKVHFLLSYWQDEGL